MNRTQEYYRKAIKKATTVMWFALSCSGGLLATGHNILSAVALVVALISFEERRDLQHIFNANED